MSNRKNTLVPDRRTDSRHKTQRRYASQTLFHDVREIVIEHAGYEYRLRITRHDKLLLTK